MEDEPVNCIYCTVRPIDPDWAPYCGAECAVDAYVVDVEPGVRGAFALGDALRPAWEGLQRSKRRCWPKAQHETQELADTHIVALRARGLAVENERAGYLKSYRCVHCEKYHVGHARKGVS